MSQKKIIIILSIIVLLGLAIVLVWKTIGFSRLATSFLGEPDQFILIDMDGNGIVDNNDLEKYTTLYKKGNLKADIDGNKIVEIQDLTLYTLLYRESQ